MNGPAPSLQEQQSGSQAPVLYALSILVVFLSLAALYESWTVPISVIMVVPLGILGAVAAATALHLENDVYFQVGLLVTMGLSSKNAIRSSNSRAISKRRASRRSKPRRSRASAVAADLMTSLAFVLGVCRSPSPPAPVG